MGVQGGGGGGGSAGRGYDYTAQLSQALQTIWGPQAQALQGMYGGASNLMNQQGGQMQGAAQGAVASSLPGMQSGIAGLQKLAGGGGPLAQYAQPNNALAQQQLGQYSQQVGQEFNRTIMPGIRSGAGITGNMGGSRAALAQGVAAGDAARATAQGGTDLYAQQYGLGAQAAGGLSQQMLGAAAALPGAAGEYYNMQMQPYQAAWAPYMTMAGILGGPTALSGSQGISMGENWNTQQQKGTKPSYGFNLW